MAILGPFVGYVSAREAKIWLQYEEAGSPQTIIVRLLGQEGGTQSQELRLTSDILFADCAHFEGLIPDQLYRYSLSKLVDGQEIELPLDGLAREDLEFRTLPDGDSLHTLDFLLMSCHNPFSSKGSGNGFEVWQSMPQIIEQNRNVRFAILAGDQIYADEIENTVLKETDSAKRERFYIETYRKYWSHIDYRKVLCRLPSVMMWDDHDITDGWGSRIDSFESSDSDRIRPEWQSLFETAHKAFGRMQAIRNPGTGVKSSGPYDCYFRIGRVGFTMLDLRTNRNVKKKQIVSKEQLTQLQAWLDANDDLDVVFFVSSVVFSHAAPNIDNLVLKHWPTIERGMNWVLRIPFVRSIHKAIRDIGDLRDDINDSWGAEVNAEQTDEVLELLFNWQNRPTVTGAAVILSGDIHTPGYATIFSSGHTRAVIPHITATPISYQPFSWLAEAIYREKSKVVRLGSSGRFTSQVSHHFCRRNVVVGSLRYFGEQQQEVHLKVKYYLEGYPEPQIMLFDLRRGSHREDIEWPDSTAAPSPVASAVLTQP